MLPYKLQKIIPKEIFMEFIFATEDLKVNKYFFVIGFYKVERNIKFNFRFGVVANFDLSPK